MKELSNFKYGYDQRVGGEIYTVCGNINERTRTVGLWFRVAFWKNESTYRRRENETHTLDVRVSMHR